MSNFLIYFSQRALAEITEMIRTSSLLHKGIVNINDGSLGTAEMGHMLFGNQMALLSGDYLLSSTCAELASLRNQDVSIHNIYLSLFLFVNTLYKLIHVCRYSLTVFS